jgi:SAM-dependent methyltransferase
MNQNIVDGIYANHNSFRSVQKPLQKVLSLLDDGTIGINVGAGGRRLHKNLKNLDLFEGPNTDIVSTAEKIPCGDNSFQVVISQETLEHVQDFKAAIKEMYRITKVGGVLYCQVPFVIGYHPGPTDFWRFTKEGLKTFIEEVGYSIEELKPAVGPGFGFYRILVEYLAILFSFLLPFLYKPFKGFFALLLYPIKLTDLFLIKSKQVDKIAGGYYVIARK